MTAASGCGMNIKGLLATAAMTAGLAVGRRTATQA